MRKYALFIVGSMLVLIMGVDNVAAQQRSLKMERAGFVRNSDGEWKYSKPTTQIVIDVTVETESVKIGPYARYAQNSLGVIAPLSDRKNSTIMDVKISYFDTDSQSAPVIENTLPESTEAVLSHTRSQNDFVRVLPDRMGNVNQSMEYMAQDAADMIFAIRRHRMELITGDAGENVFGAGLDAALKELDRLENEYLSLFLGKTTVSTETYRFVIMPEKGKNAYIVCRFSDSDGILPQSDMAGQPVILDMKGEGLYDALVPRYTSKDAARVEFEPVCVADNVTCRVMNGTNVLAEQVIPVFQFGDIYDMDVNAFSIK